MIIVGRDAEEEQPLFESFRANLICFFSSVLCGAFAIIIAVAAVLNIVHWVWIPFFLIVALCLFLIGVIFDLQKVDLRREDP